LHDESYTSLAKVLDELLASVGIKREEVYITNIVKDRPPFNRDPLPDEIAAYGDGCPQESDAVNR